MTKPNTLDSVSSSELLAVGFKVTYKKAAPNSRLYQKARASGEHFEIGRIETGEPLTIRDDFPKRKPQATTKGSRCRKTHRSNA